MAQRNDRSPEHKSGQHWYIVPKNTRPSTCKGCDAPMYWITNDRDRRVPIDCDVEGAHAPTQREDGYGVSHFTTCPDAERFSGRGGARRA